MTEGVIEQPQPQTEQVQPEPALSITEHAARYSPGADRTAEAEPELKPIRPVDQQKREQGKFAEGKQPIRGKEAVKRINELTSRAKTAEERFADAEGRLANAERELSQLRQQRAPRQEIARAEQRVEQAEAKVEQSPQRVIDPKDPEPQEADAKYGNDFGKYLEDKARWSARDEWRQIQAGQKHAAEQGRVQQAATKVLRTFGERVTAAKLDHDDYAQIAFEGESPWDEGSPIDAFIMEHDSGAKMLYYLRHPNNAQELGEILRQSPLNQLTRLAVIAQRFSPPTPTQAGPTGSATGRQVIKLPPRPPNPVRTEAQRASDGPPTTDGSLTVMGHAKAFRKA